MSAPNVTITKKSAAAVQAEQAANGILAIVAPCLGSASLPVNVPTPVTDTGTVQTLCQEGPQCEMASYFIGTARKGALLVRPTTSTPAYYGDQPGSTLICGGAAGLHVAAVPSNGPPAHITVTGHGFPSTMTPVVTISGATGDTAINGTFVAAVVDANTLSLAGVTGSGSYTANSATIVWTGVTYTGTGTAVPTAGSASAIADDYPNATLKITSGGTLGTGPISFQVALDGVTFGAPVTITTATSYTPLVPITGVSSGVVINLGTATETLVTGDVIGISAVGPRMNSSDLVAALNALGKTAFDWDLVLVHGETSDALVADQDTWSTALGAKGMFPFLLSNTRLHDVLAGETDATFQVAMSSILASATTINVSVGTDGAAFQSPVSGLSKPQPTSLYIATRLEQVALGTDAAQVLDGAVPKANITGANGLPAWHDEFQEGGLDDGPPGAGAFVIRLSTLRTFATRPGTYITNAYILSGPGSAYIYAQNARVMNAAAAASYQEAETLLSSPVDLNPQGFIASYEAKRIEKAVQVVVDDVIDGQVSGVQFRISQNTPVGPGGAMTVQGGLYVQGLGYIKQWNIVTQLSQAA